MPISSSTRTAGQIVRYLKRRSANRPRRSPNPGRATVAVINGLVKSSQASGPRRRAGDADARGHERVLGAHVGKDLDADVTVDGRLHAVLVEELAALDAEPLLEHQLGV